MRVSDRDVRKRKEFLLAKDKAYITGEENEATKLTRGPR